MQGKPDLGVASLRGVAAILMVAGHVIGDSPTTALKVPDDSLWRLYAETFADIRMPLFTILSGFVYAYRPLSSLSGYGGVVAGKSRRLLLPLLTVGTLVFLSQLFVPGTTNTPAPEDFWRTYVFGYEYLWFLQSIFVIFVLVALLDGSGLLATMRRWGVVFAVACVLSIVVVVPEHVDVFSVSGAIALLPFFLLGYATNLYSDRFGRRVLVVTAVSFAVLFPLRVLEVLGVLATPAPLLNRALSVLVGVTACLLLVLVRDRLYVGALAWLGQFAFTIYLLHPFGSSMLRMVIERLGGAPVPVIFVLCLTAGLAVPILFQITFGRLKWVSQAMLGQRPQRVATFPRRASAVTA